MQIGQNSKIPKYKHDKVQQKKRKRVIGQNAKEQIQFRQNSKRQNVNMAKYKVK